MLTAVDANNLPSRESLDGESSTVPQRECMRVAYIASVDGRGLNASLTRTWSARQDSCGMRSARVGESRWRELAQH